MNEPGTTTEYRPMYNNEPGTRLALTVSSSCQHMKERHAICISIVFAP